MMDISPYILQGLTLMIVFSLAIISPGPDFIIAVRNSIVQSRRSGVLTAVGIGAGVLVHVTYNLVGIAALISQSVLLFTLIKWAGAAYLVYIGVQALRSRGMGQSVIDNAAAEAVRAQKTMSGLAAFRAGFLTNVLNPKATLFFLAVFSQIIQPGTPVVWQAAYGLGCAFMAATWFSLVSLVLTQGPVRSVFLRATKWIDRVCGGLMIALGVKVALAAR